MERCGYWLCKLKINITPLEVTRHDKIIHWANIPEDTAAGQPVWSVAVTTANYVLVIRWTLTSCDISTMWPLLCPSIFSIRCTWHPPALQLPLSCMKSDKTISYQSNGTNNGYQGDMSMEEKIVLASSNSTMYWSSSHIVDRFRLDSVPLGDAYTHLQTGSSLV